MSILNLFLLLITGSFSSIKSFDAKYANEIKMEVLGKTILIKTDILVHANKKQTVIKYENPGSNSQNTIMPSSDLPAKAGYSKYPAV